MRYASAKGTARDEAVLVEQIRLLSRRRYDLVLNLAVATFVAAVLWRAFPAWERFTWLALISTSVLARGLILRHFIHAKSDVGRIWTFDVARAKLGGLCYTGATLITGSLWGLSGTVSLVTSNPLDLVLTAFVLGGIMAGGIVSNAAYRPALLALLVPIALPTVGILLTRSTTVGTEMGVLFAMLATVLVASGLSINETIVESLRLRIEQEFLVVELHSRDASIAEAQSLAQVGGVEFDFANHTIACSDQIFRILGKDPRTFDATFDGLLGVVHPDDRAEVAARIAKFAETGANNQVDYRLLLDDGSIRYVQSIGRKVDVAGGPSRYFASVQDVTARNESENKLQFANVLLKTEIEASPDGILVVDQQRQILLVNHRFAEMWGIESDLEVLTDEIALRNVISRVKDPDAFAMRVQYLYDHPAETGDEEVELLDGRTIDRRTAVLATPDGTILGRVWYFRDITARKNAESLAIRMAHYDVLTGLANRSLFVEALGHAIAEAKRGKETFAVIYLDLDHFKDVNDTLGHGVGDELLKAVATRLHASVRAIDTAARFGGDEFAVVVSDVGEPAEVAVVADNILRVLAEPFSVRGNDIRTSASIGIDLFGPQSADAEALLSHADVALYRAKAEGRGGYRFFTDAMDKEVRTRVTLGAELRTAVTSGQLFLMYQPQVQIESGRITGLEALVRWNHPTRGVLGPGVFIPVAESTGIVVALGQWVLFAACRQTKAWLDAGIEPVRVAVNVSGLQFKTPNELEANIAAAFAETGLPARLLEIELTETVLVGVSREHGATLTRLRKAGVTIAIDDFGTGFSSLGYLIRFPVDRIKIAQDFIRDVTTMPGQAAIAKATIGLARDLGIAVIAEGVETREQLEALKGWGCPEIQGFYFAKPLSVDDVTLAFRSGGILKPRVLALT